MREGDNVSSLSVLLLMPVVHFKASNEVVIVNVDGMLESGCNPSVESCGDEEGEHNS